MIISECGHARSACQITEHLAECGGQVTHSFQLIPGVVTGLSPDALKKFLARYPNAKVLPDRRRQIPPMPFGPDEWAEVAGPSERIATSPGEPHLSPLALSLMKADDVQNLGIDGSGIRVCVIDSGVDFGHPDLQEVAIVGADGKPLAADFTETDLTDTIGHGTAVAGCIAAQARQTYTLTDEQSGAPVGYTRIKGVAPGSKIMSAKVFDARVSSGYDSAIIAALEWAADNGAHIINMSLGGAAMPNDGQDPLAAAVTALRNRGIVVTVSAGNSGGGLGTLKSPGSSPGAVTVGASTMYRSFAELGFLAEPGKWTSDQLAAFSSLGPSADGRMKPDLLAPGAYDWGLAPTVGSEEGQNFQLFGGTSQAAPFVAGAAALVLQAFHKKTGTYPTPKQAIELLLSTADDLGLPAHMQGAGRVNCLRAVQAALGQGQALACSPPAPVVIEPGKEAEVSMELCNAGEEKIDLNLEVVHFEIAPERSKIFNGTIATTGSPQTISFDVPEGTDLMQVVLGWPSGEHGPRSPRLMLAVYDPEGKFVNYQRPNSSGDVELGNSVDTWAARPQAGRWTARVVLRLGKRDTVQSYTLSVRAFRRQVWTWFEPSAARLSLGPGQIERLTLRARVPRGARAGTHSGHLRMGNMVVPLAVVVPVALDRGMASFAGKFEHGYQGSWGNGDWIYHDVTVPAGTRSMITSIQWPDVDNALECYLIDPRGHTVMGRSNTADILDDGNSTVAGSQMVLANPQPGRWQIALHSFAFCGRGEPEPYTGSVEVGGELVSPRSVNMKVAAGGQAPMALLVRNPGRMPLTIQAVVQSTEIRLLWRTISQQIKTGVGADGRAEGKGHVTLAVVDVPYGARQVGATLVWDQKDAEVSLSLFDSIAQNDRASSTGSAGQVSVLENNPVPGEWTVVAGLTRPNMERQSIQLRGATFVVAPKPLADVATQSITVQPGATAVLPVTVTLPEKAKALTGTIIVTTTAGDLLGQVGFDIQAEEQAPAQAASAAS